MAPADPRYGPYVPQRPLARAPGALFLEGRSDDGQRVLLQVAHLSPAADASAEDRRQAYVHMAARATEDLQRDEDPKVLAHGAVEQDDGSLSLYWALPWVDGAEQLGIIQPPTPDDLLQWSSWLLTRLQQRHERGRIDPLLSPSVLVVRPKQSPKVVGLPIHLPVEWPAPELAPPPRAPEEQRAQEPSRSGDLWRVGRCLSALAAGVPTPPHRWQAFLSRLLQDSPKDRFSSAQAALQELQRVGASAPTLPMSASENPLSSDLILKAPPAKDESEPDDEEEFNGDTRLDFPSPLKAEQAVPVITGKPVPMTYQGGGELETIRAPFPEEASTAVPKVQAAGPRAPSTIPDGETLLDVVRPREIRQYGIPDEPPTDPPKGPRPPMAEDPASQMTLRDVPREKLEAMDSGEEPTDERNKKRKSWEAVPHVSAPHPAHPAAQLLATGPKGTVVGVRMIENPTGMREVPEDALHQMLPPPEPSIQPDAPPRHAASPSGDIPLPAARVVQHTNTDLPSLSPPVAKAPTPAAHNAPPPSALAPLGQGAWSPPPAAQTPPGPSIMPAKTVAGVSPPPAWAQGQPAGRSLVPSPDRSAAPAAWGHPASSEDRRRSPWTGLLLGISAFFVAGAGAALLMSGVLTDSSQVVDGSAAPAVVTITAANEVLVQATPSNAVVVSERTGRILGSPPLRFLVPGGGSVAILIAAKGHEPQRVLLPERGRIRSDLVPLPEDIESCDMDIQAPEGVQLEGVAGAKFGGSKSTIIGAALVRGTKAEGAWLVRCPQLGGAKNPRLKPNAKMGPVTLRVIGPTDAEVFLNGEPLGRVPVKQRVQPGFHEVRVEKISRGSVERLVPVFAPTKLRMPMPELAKSGE